MDTLKTCPNCKSSVDRLWITEMKLKAKSELMISASQYDTVLKCAHCMTQAETDEITKATELLSKYEDIPVEDIAMVIMHALPDLPPNPTTDDIAKLLDEEFGLTGLE